MGDRVRKKVHESPGLNSSAPSPPWIDLPTDVTANILHRLGAIEILETAQKVCATWRTVCKDPAMWRVIHMSYGGVNRKKSNYLGVLCRRAVDHSQGELIDINIQYYGTDDLLLYISDRSSRLRRLTIACCDRISSKGLTSAVKKLPQLEELHLFYMARITAEDIEAIGICCPMLKSFTFNRQGCDLVVFENDYALTVAKNMPSLRQLRLFGDLLNNEGVEIILNGCPHLELLDLRQCFNVDLQGDLDKRCSERIKDLRRTFDSTADYEWDDKVYDETEEDYDIDDYYHYFFDEPYEYDDFLWPQ